jgi:hypothetical protein
VASEERLNQRKSRPELRARIAAVRMSLIVAMLFRSALRLLVSEPAAPTFVLFPCMVPLQRDLYRAHASDCLEEARAVKNRELCNVFHRLAMWWVILAHQTEDDDRGLLPPQDPNRVTLAISNASSRERHHSVQASAALVPSSTPSPISELRTTHQGGEAQRASP